MNGVFFDDGDRLPATRNQSHCEKCYCLRGKSTCVRQECGMNIPGCRPLYRSSDCCPYKYDCGLYIEQSYKVFQTCLTNIKFLCKFNSKKAKNHRPPHRQRRPLTLVSEPGVNTKDASFRRVHEFRQQTNANIVTASKIQSCALSKNVPLQNVKTVYRFTQITKLVVLTVMNVVSNLKIPKT